MKYSLNQIMNAADGLFSVDEVVNFSEIAKQHHEIRKLSEVTIKGSAHVSNQMIIFDLDIHCDLTLACAITLEDVIYPIDIKTREYFSFDKHAKEEDFEDDVTVIKGQIVELAPVVWQNIVVNVPLRVLSPNAYDRVANSGDNFEIIDQTEDQERKSESIDPRFAKLKDLL